MGALAFGLALVSLLCAPQARSSPSVPHSFAEDFGWCRLAHRPSDSSDSRGSLFPRLHPERPRLLFTGPGNAACFLPWSLVLLYSLSNVVIILQPLGLAWKSPQLLVLLLFPKTNQDPKY